MKKELRELLVKFQTGESIHPLLLSDGDVVEAVNFLKETSLSDISEFDHDYIEDVYVFSEDEKALKIEQTREIIEKAYVKSARDFNIFVIRNIENLTLQAGNSLLKLFEDVPPNTIFLLTTSAKEKMLDTLASRVIAISENKPHHVVDPYLSDKIDTYFSGNKSELLAFLYKERLQKEEYISIIYALVKKIEEGYIHDVHTIEKIRNAFITITSTNANPRWVVDDIFLSL